MTGADDGMDDRTVKKKIIRMYADGKAKNFADDMAAEKRMILEVDGRAEAVVIMTPCEEELWAIGNLRCRRMITDLSDIKSIDMVRDKIVVKRSIRREGWHIEVRFLHTASGAFLREENNENPSCRLPVEWQMSFEAIMSGLDWISEAPIYRRTGAVHVAALVSPLGERLFRTEDVGRHNAVDKAVGWLIKHAVAPGDVSLITSGRLPEDMVLKCVGAGIPFMTSVSAATSEGVETARRCNMTLIGFGRNGKFNIYSAPERICRAADKRMSEGESIA